MKLSAFVMAFALFSTPTSVFAHWWHSESLEEAQKEANHKVLQEQVEQTRKALHEAKEVLESGVRVEQDQRIHYRLNRGAQVLSTFIGASYIAVYVSDYIFLLGERLDQSGATRRALVADVAGITAFLAGAPGAFTSELALRRIPVVKGWNTATRMIGWFTVLALAYGIEHFGGGRQEIELTQSDMDELRLKVLELESSLRDLEEKLKAF